MSSPLGELSQFEKPSEDTEHVMQPPVLHRHMSAMPLVSNVDRMAYKTGEAMAIEALMTKLTEQHQVKQKSPFSMRNDSSSSSSSDLFATTPSTERPDSVMEGETAEVKRLKKQLELTTERMAQMDLEINQFRLAQRTVEQAIGSPFPAAQDLGFRHGATASSSHNDVTAAFVHLNQPHNTASGTTHHGFPKHEGFLHSSSSFSSFGRAQLLYPDNAARLPGITPPITPMAQVPAYGSSHGTASQLQAPIGTRLSPMANEFNSWQPMSTQPAQVSYMSTAEPLNYRRLLDRNMNCDWKYIVDKIVCNNDQQASIFLQQKLKVGTAEQKFEIVQAIIDQAYRLMVNRFGNFLVQRCFEHGTPDQIVAIALSVRGNTLNLSMDPFGCHVVQKAFDYVPEEYKAIMVHELLRRIPETIIHRYACHVWQKLFELRWSESPPQIMRYVNEALCGMWHEVALGETGSLVVQNIFENCLEEDKRPCIEEVLANIDIVAHGQFGNWCIQHICEHGAVPDRTRAVDHVIRFATEYSIDQFASKVVEKCLKIGGTDFLDRYLSRVCESRPDRPRMALIDIAGDQFGNYLIHYVLSNADTQRREIVATHVRKHMVSLRGSKYGSRVAMLCCSPSYAARPDPTIPLSGRYGSYFESSRQTDRGYPNVGRKSYIPYR